MGIKTHNISIKDVSKDFKMGLKDYSFIYANGILLKEFLVGYDYQNSIKSGRTPSKFRPDYWNGCHDFITLSDVNTNTYSLYETVEEQITDNAISECQNLVCVPAESVLISNAMTVGLAFYVDREVYINQNVFWLKLDEKKINKKFLVWYLSEYLKEAFKKVYYSKYLSKKELSMICIPNISPSKQKEIADKIKIIEKQIHLLETTITPMDTIIDSVYGKRFGYDKKTKGLIRKGMTFGTQNSVSGQSHCFEISFGQINNSAIRLSARANSNIFTVMDAIVDRIGYIKVKDILIEDIHRGCEPSYEVDGDVPVVKTAHLTNQSVVVSESEFVKRELYERKVKAQVKCGDVLLASTGKPSIGKIDLVTAEQDLFADGHISIIRINEGLYNKQFFVYWFRCILGCYQLERDFVGSTNQIEIYPDQIREFKIPDISIKEQERIVDEISDGIDKNNKIKKQIEDLRKHICEIMNKAVR